ncbi:CpsD/CapB family tyrosine-protein kinase [Candidatus Viridilinea mediisalina]|uniref:non-specific protein-tyrosine kinase n=1 Tax=Candidatus Viridilinea mediisalina TaxID=2024553 RepID=A0A2A6RLU6_9CHLR|nr:CpsD/CapB family tyrosine-protein kinase [Candidatus Viridilinea mediisalina]PDW03913.1 capsular biosynthesis protein [Candidatus Viridilinea mediisalina]
MSSNGSTAETTLVTLRDPGSPAAEAYRTLRTNILFSSLDRPLRTLLVTSTAPNEGKSTTLANLAVTMAQAEQRVLVVDCDLRRPSLHTLFGLPNEQGLTSAILAQNDDLPPAQATVVPGLKVLTSGPLPPRPADLLGSRRMAAMIERMSANADIVLFDTPPVVAVTDAAALAPRVDGVLLVLHAGHTRRDRAREARQLLEKVKANIVGVVLNGAKQERGYTY